MANIITARLSRNDAQPWGFRLQGGKDFGTPLVIQKVHTGSIADQAGLKAGDAVVKINNTDLFNLRHKDAQDAIVRAGPTFDMVIQRGAAWKPTVTPLSSAAASPIPGNYAPVTKTSLAANQQPISAIGTGHNTAARPFVPASPVRSIVNKQYNTPVAMYSEETIAESLTSQAEVLAGGCLGVNFKKNEKVYNPEKSEVLKALQENDSEPEPVGSTFYWRQSHAIGGSATSHNSTRPLTPSYQVIPDTTKGTPLQQNSLAPAASHRPSLPIQPLSQPPKPVIPKPAAPQKSAFDGVFVRIKDKNLHVECFKCATCGTSLKNQGYYNLNNKLYCDVHARLAAMNSPPPNANGLTPVTFPPKNLGANTISSALNAHAGNMNGNHHQLNGHTPVEYIKQKPKLNDDNNNVIPCDNRSTTSETSECSSLSSCDRESDKVDGEGFQYRTMNGKIIKSVIPPGKGIKVDYKVPSNISGPKPFSYTPSAIPSAAPKSPSSYPPPSQPTWAPPSAVQAPAPVAMPAPKPAGQTQGGWKKPGGGFKPKDQTDENNKTCNSKNGSGNNSRRQSVEKRIEVYDSDEEFDPQVELAKIAKPPPSNFVWPPPIEEEKVPIAAPLYKPVPETLHVTVKPCAYRPLQHRQYVRKEPLEIENCFLNVESNITATTTSTSNASSESEYKMYQTQNNHYANMFEQHQTKEVDDEVESINKVIDLRKSPPPIELPKDIKIIDFVEPPPNYQAETFTNVFSNRKEKWMTITETKKTVKKEVKISDKEEIIEDPDEEEENDVEEEIKGHHVGPYDGTYYQLAPSNIPHPTPKGYQSGLQKALIYSSDKPYHMKDIPATPEPQFFQLDHYEKAVKEVESLPSPPKEIKKEKIKFEVRTSTEQREFPHNEPLPRQGNTLLSSMMRTASPRPMEFVRSNAIEEITLPDEIDAYFPPPISMQPNEPYPSLESYRTKSPFVSALITIPDRPFTPFGREIMSQLSLDLPQNMQKSTFSNALHTAPDASFDPSSLEYDYVESNEAPVEYTAKVYERIAVETDEYEEEHASCYGRVTPMSRAFLPTIQPWSTPSEQVPENSFKDTISSRRESMECSVSDSRRASEVPNVPSRRESAAVCEPMCCKKNISDLLKEPVKEEEEFDPELPNENAPYPKRNQPSPFEGMQVKVTNKMTSSLHKPDEIPTYQRKWFNLPTQNPVHTPEPEELKDNVPMAFQEWITEDIQTAAKPPIPHESHRGSVSERVQKLEDVEYKFPERRASQSTGLFPTKSTFHKEPIEIFLEREAEEEKSDRLFPVSKKAPSESSFPTNNPRKNSVLDLPQKQKDNFERVKSLKHELELQHQRMQNKARLRQQKELENMQKPSSRLTHETIKEEIEQNQELSSYQKEQEYKRQLEFEKEQREKEKAIREQQAREQEYQHQMEEARIHDAKMKEKREREYQMQLQREMEYRKQKEAQEEMARINQEERDRVLRRQQEEVEREILRQQEQERREAEERETRRQLELRRKEERDRELAKIEEELRQKREEELKKLEEEIRMKREQEKENFMVEKQKREKERKEREFAEQEAKRLEREAMDAQRVREQELQAELKIRQKQEADRKQREEMELFNIEEERKRNEEISIKRSYQASSFQQQMVWPPSNSSTPAPHSHRQAPSEHESSSNKFHFEPLDEEQKRFMAAIRPPSVCYSPPTDDKPFPSIPYYQQHLAFFEAKPDHEGLFDPRSASPAIRNRCRSPAFGPPPNPLKAFVNKQRDPELDESGIYLCGERLLSPVWYEKQQKKIPPGVQRRLPIHGSQVASKVHKQEAGTKPPPTPPPMPKTTKKMCFAPDEKEAVAIISEMPPKVCNKKVDSSLATDLLKESVDRLNINNESLDFRKNASGVIAAMLEARMNKKQPTQQILSVNKVIVEDPEFLPPPPPAILSRQQSTIIEDLPLPPPPSPCKIPSSILTPPLSSDENDLPQICTNTGNDEKVTYRHKKHHQPNNQSSHDNNRCSNKPELSTHARDRRSYIERNNNEISFNGASGIDKETLDSISKDIANGQHPVCDKCKCKITRGPFVTALGKTWCPSHFLCVNPNCRRELMDIGFVEEKGDLYCEYCFEQFLAPPCSKCNGKIKGDCLNAIGRKFHPECFKCTYCGKLFGNSPFFLEEGEPYCEADWNELFTTKCFACGFPVEAGDRWVEALNNNYHSQCFNCTYCKKNLEGQSFFAKGGRPFCKNHAR